MVVFFTFFAKNLYDLIILPWYRIKMFISHIQTSICKNFKECIDFTPFTYIATKSFVFVRHCHSIKVINIRLS